MAAPGDHWAVGRSVEALPTPSCVVDANRLEANVDRWQRMCERSGVAFRPHAKTHKTIELARLQLEAGACGMTCATVGEAEVLAEAGVHDLVVAYPLLSLDGCRRLAALAALGARLGTNVDSEFGARRLGAAAVEAGVTVRVHLDVDTGLGRSGVDKHDVPGLLRLARLVSGLEGLELQGVTTYRGAMYREAPAEAADAGVEEARLVTSLAEALRREGVVLGTVSAGSTPTGLAVAGSKGMTEIRAGTYVFNDLMQVELGAATWDQVALSIMTTVVSTGASWATIDAGSKTFGGDVRAPQGDGPAVYARAADRPATITRMSEELGIVENRSEGLKLGELVHWYPAHACTCVNLADELFIVRAGVVEHVWSVAARGHRS